MDLQFLSFSGLYMTIMSVLLLMDIWLFFELIREKEYAGAKKALFIGFIILGSSILLLWIDLDWLYIIELISFLILCVFIFFPGKFNKSLTDDVPVVKYDERDIMFSRKELIPGTKRYDRYYQKNPDKEIRDISFRKEAGLLSKDSLYFYEPAFTAARSYFKEIDEKLAPDIKGNDNTIERRDTEDMESVSSMIKKISRDMGALDMGVCACKDYHFYSIKGRGERYDQPVLNDHEYAIAFTVEMDAEMVAAAPKASIVMESARQYLLSGRIAVAIAKYIRSLGYSATAHIDGNYEVICPLVARDAGLGEIGRMGILMTPKHGPRVRIAVVTTDLPLKATTYVKDHSLINFCMECKKCSLSCPSKSIQMDAPKDWEGVTRWKIDSESCFSYWAKAGTDCGRCMAVCPYSHPNTLLHKLTRVGIRKSKSFAEFALILDDFFYGKKPVPKKLPKQKIQKIIENFPSL